MVHAEIGWGLRGKPARSSDDYTVLAAGGSVFTKGDFANIFARFSPGNPPMGREGPGALPWAVFGVFQGPSEHYLGLIIQDWSNDTDAAGRPISLSRCFVIPYTLVADNRLSYRGLYAALHAVDLPPDGRALELEFPKVPEDMPAALVERFGFDKAAAAASLLLEGPVTVTRAEETSIEERIEFLDAVAALLPYGWRTRLTASTWHNEGSRRLQLAFARQRRPDSTELDWQALRPPAPLGGIASRYREQLHDLTSVGGRSQADIVRYMADRDTPWNSRTDPATALVDLEDLNRPDTIYRNVRRGRVDGQELRWLFGSGRFRELLRRPQAVSLLLDQLILLGDVGDLQLVAPVWGRAGGSLEALVKAAQTKLWGRERTGEEIHYLRFAERFGYADEFLAALLKRPVFAEGSEGDEAAARLVLASVRWDGEGGHTRTLQAVAGNHPVLSRLLHRLAAEARPDLEVWLRELESRAPVFMESFSRMLRGDARGVDSAALVKLADYDHDAVPWLLFVAEARGRLRQVLVEFVHLLIDDTRLGYERWATQISALDPADEYDQGMLDALLLWLDRQPSQLLRSPGGDRSRYQKGFAAMCALSGVASGRERLFTRLAEHLRRGEWYRDPRQTSAVLELVSAYPGEPDLAEAMLAVRAEAPELIGDDRYLFWRQQVFEEMPYMAGREPVLILTSLTANADPEKVARICAELIRRQIRVGDIVGILRQSDWLPTSEQVIRMVLGTRRVLLETMASEHYAKQNSLALAKELVSVRGQDVESAFQRQLAEKAHRELDYHYELLKSISTDRANESAVHLEEEARDRLVELSGKLKKLADAGRPRKRFGL